MRSLRKDEFKMDRITSRHFDEMDRMYDSLSKLEPGTDEYEKLLSQIMKAEDRKIEIDKLNDARQESKSKNEDAAKERKIRIALGIAPLIVTPVIDLLCKRNLTKVIGKIEQMEIFTSTPGRSISSWFRK